MRIQKGLLDYFHNLRTSRSINIADNFGKYLQSAKRISPKDLFNYQYYDSCNNGFVARKGRTPSPSDDFLEHRMEEPCCMKENSRSHGACIVCTSSEILRMTLAIQNQQSAFKSIV